MSFGVISVGVKFGNFHFTFFSLSADEGFRAVASHRGIEFVLN